MGTPTLGNRRTKTLLERPLFYPIWDVWWAENWPGNSPPARYVLAPIAALDRRRQRTPELRIYCVAMPDQPIDTVLLPQLLLPIAPRNVVLEQHGVAIADGSIVEIDTNEELLRRYPQARHVELDHHVVLPGFVNAHGHLAMSLLRGLGESLPLERWLSEVIWPLEAEHVSPQFVVDGTNLAIAEMLERGITTASDMYFFPEAAANTALQAGFRLQAAFPIFEAANAYAEGAADCIHKGLALCDQFRNSPTVHAAFGPHAAYSVSPANLDRILTLASELYLPIQMHLHETRTEVSDAQAKQGCSWIELLESRGMLVPELQAVHMTTLTQQELDLVAERGVQVVHCPHSNLKLASGYCPVAELRERGVTVSLGTDGAASSNDLDLISEARLAGLLSKLDLGDPSVLPAPDLLAMATIEGAKSLGLDELIGSVEAGKSADLIAIDTNTPSLQPLHDVHAQLVHTDAAKHVTHVWVAGRCLYDDRVHSSVDVEQTLAHAREWRGRLSA